MKNSFLKSLRDPDRFVLVLLGLVLLERIFLFFVIGPASISGSDDVGYLAGGLFFAETGMITVWEKVPTALIMPGMPLVTGLMALLFGESLAYLVSLKILWILMGCLTPWFVYKMVSLFVPRWYGILAAASFLLPNFAWMDNLILTETPYLLFSTMCLYYTFQMGESADRKYLRGYVLSFLLALFFRANILVMPVFTWAYLLLKRKYGWKELIRRLVVLAAVSLILLLPWTIRNAIRFDAFIPVSYGTYHPTMLGTYQGYGYPSDEELDYQTNVEEAVREVYPRYFNEDGSLKDPLQDQYITHLKHKLKLEYRLEQWWQKDPVSLLVSFLVIKPRTLLNWPWYWGTGHQIILPFLEGLGMVNFFLCAGTVLLSLVSRRKREICLFLTGYYFLNIYMIAMSCAIERYAALHMVTRYMLASIGIYLAVEAVKAWKARRTGDTQ